jgi:hypothetical protein
MGTVGPVQTGTCNCYAQLLYYTAVELTGSTGSTSS